MIDPFVAVTDYSEKEIGKENYACTDQGDDPRIAEPGLPWEFGPSILFSEGLDNFQHQRLAVLLIAHQHHAIAFLICEKYR